MKHPELKLFASDLKSPWYVVSVRFAEMGIGVL